MKTSLNFDNLLIIILSILFVVSTLSTLAYREILDKYKQAIYDGRIIIANDKAFKCKAVEVHE